MAGMRWTNATGNFSAKDPANWEGGIIPETVEEWEAATGATGKPEPIGYFPPDPHADIADDTRLDCWAEQDTVMEG